MRVTNPHLKGAIPLLYSIVSAVVELSFSFSLSSDHQSSILGLCLFSRDSPGIHIDTSFPLCHHSHVDLEFITSPPYTIQKYNFEEILISPAYSFLSFSGEEDKRYFVFRIIFYRVQCTRPDDNCTKSAVKQCQKGENTD